MTEPRKPREYWFVPDPSNTWAKKPSYEVEGIVHVREVLPQAEGEPKETDYKLRYLQEQLRLANFDAIQNEAEANELRTRVAELEKAKDRLRVRVEGMILSLEKHGQNINVQFHIDWLSKGLEWSEKK